MLKEIHKYLPRLHWLYFLRSFQSKMLLTKFLSKNFTFILHSWYFIKTEIFTWHNKVCLHVTGKSLPYGVIVGTAEGRHHCLKLYISIFNFTRTSLIHGITWEYPKPIRAPHMNNKFFEGAKLRNGSGPTRSRAIAMSRFPKMDIMTGYEKRSQH